MQHTLFTQQHSHQALRAHRSHGTCAHGLHDAGRTCTRPSRLAGLWRPSSKTRTNAAAGPEQDEGLTKEQLPQVVKQLQEQQTEGWEQMRAAVKQQAGNAATPDAADDVEESLRSRRRAVMDSMRQRMQGRSEQSSSSTTTSNSSSSTSGEPSTSAGRRKLFDLADYARRPDSFSRIRSNDPYEEVMQSSGQRASRGTQGRGQEDGQGRGRLHRQQEHERVRGALHQALDGEEGGPQSSRGRSREASAGRESRVTLSRDLPIVRAGSDADLEGHFFSQRSDWSRLGLKADVQAALAKLGITRPSHVQESMLQAWSSKEALHYIIADQAGSGKTLAYLLPLVQAIRTDDAAAGKPNTQSKSPRAVVLAPTTELVQQVYRVAKAISNAGAHMRVAAMTGGQTDRKERDKSFRTQRETLDGGVDMVICTPGRFTEHLAAGNVNLDAAKGVVLDEVDVLMGDTTNFANQIAPLRAVAPRSLRYVFVTATLPQHTADELVTQWPDMAFASGPGLHRTAAGLTEELVDCSGGDDVSLESGTQRKLEALGRSLRKHRAARSLVFSNKIEACRDVENYLRRHFEGEDLKVLVYHEAIRENLRNANMNAFLSAMPEDGRGERMVMVATDRMSRGIDSMYCGHVVLFDFPRDPSEYVRRVGRTARAGTKGVVTALVLGRQVGLAKDVIGGNQKGKPIHKLPDL